jgi:ABC-type multidrug transport system fused ATPase/permease subunit
MPGGSTHRDFMKRIQCIYFARAVLKNAPVVILGEVESNIEPKSEKLIWDAVLWVSSGRASAIKAYDLNSIIKAVKIALIEDGRVVEEGTGEKLIAKSEIYTKILRKQEKIFEWQVLGC